MLNSNSNHSYDHQYTYESNNNIKDHSVNINISDNKQPVISYYNPLCIFSYVISVMMFNSAKQPASLWVCSSSLRGTMIMAPCQHPGHRVFQTEGGMTWACSEDILSINATTTARATTTTIMNNSYNNSNVQNYSRNHTYYNKHNSN